LSRWTAGLVSGLQIDTVAKINLDQSNPGRCHRSHPPVILGQKPRVFSCFCRSNLHRRKTCPDLLDRSRLSSPSEHHARSNPVATRNLRHLRARHQRFFDDPHLVVMRPASPSLDHA